jgi:maleylacetate reductase
MEAFEYDGRPGRVVFGIGSRARVAAECARVGMQRVLVIASRSAWGAADALVEALGERVAAQWREVVEHVPRDLVERARRAAADADVDGVVCVGGGSAIGLAKAIVLEVEVPVVAIPTTYAGSEMTPTYGITDGHKRTGRDRRVVPSVVVYDPELTLDLPLRTSVASTANALAHCVEGLYGPGANPVTGLSAVEGIRVLAGAIPRLAPEPRDPVTRADLLYGAHLAGTVIATVGVGLHHRTCHVLGGSQGLGHADVNAVVLPHVLAYNAPEIPSVVTRIAAAIDTSDPAGALYDRFAGAGLPVSLRELGLPEVALDDVAAQVVAETTANPRAVEFASVRAMLVDAWSGVRPSSPVPR